MAASRGDPAAEGSDRSSCSTECRRRRRRRSDRSALWHGLCATATALASSGTVVFQAAAAVLIAGCLIGLKCLSGLSSTLKIFTAGLEISRSLHVLFLDCVTSRCRRAVAALCRHHRRRGRRLARSDRVGSASDDKHVRRSRSPDSDVRGRPRSRSVQPSDDSSGTDCRRNQGSGDKDYCISSAAVDVNDSDRCRRLWCRCCDTARAATHGCESRATVKLCERALLSLVDEATDLWTRAQRPSRTADTDTATRPRHHRRD